MLTQNNFNKRIVESINNSLTTINVAKIFDRFANSIFKS